MLRQAIAVEHARLLRYKLLWIEIGLLLGLLAVFSVAIYALSRNNPEAADMVRAMLLWPHGLYGGVQLIGSASDAGPLLIILIGAFMGQEYAWRTLHMLLSQGVPRSTLLAAKLVTILTVISLFVGTVLVAGGFVSAALTVALQGGIDLAEANWGKALLYAVAAGYSLLPYGVMTLMLAVVTRSVVAPVAIGLSFALLIEGVAASALFTIGGSAAMLPRFLPGDAAQSILEAVQRVGGPSQGPSPELLHPSAAVLTIAIYTVLCAAIALWALRRQDLTG